MNFPAHLVIVKGTEYFDGKVKRYVDFPITGKYFELVSRSDARLQDAIPQTYKIGCITIDAKLIKFLWD